MSKAERKFIRGMNYYVPGMQAGAQLGQLKNERMSLGAPVVALATGILNALSINAAVDTTTFETAFVQSEAQMGKYGRTLTLVASGASTSTVVVYGEDYLGQKVRESFTANGTTPVVGKKAFRRITRVTSTLTAATTISLGYGTGFGLPYVTEKVLSEYVDQVSGSVGTLTAPIFTDPQTATTGDPRGTYVPNTTPNGTKVIECDLHFSDFVNAANNGGMHGIQQFA